MKDLIKLAPLVQNWPWPKLGYVLVLGLLLRQVVNFEQAIILILLAMVIDKFRSPKARVRTDVTSLSLQAEKKKKSQRGRGS